MFAVLAYGHFAYALYPMVFFTPTAFTAPQLELITMTERVAQAAKFLGLHTLQLLVFVAGIFIGGLWSEWLSKSSPDPAVPVSS